IRRRTLLMAGGVALVPGFMNTGRPDGDTAALVPGWNAELLAVVRTPGAQPATVHPTRSFAIMHVAMRDATTACDWRAAPAAAAAQAAHDVLAALYPARAGDFAARLAADLAAVTDPGARARGVHNGSVAA